MPLPCDTVSCLFSGRKPTTARGQKHNLAPSWGLRVMGRIKVRLEYLNIRVASRIRQFTAVLSPYVLAGHVSFSSGNAFVSHQRYRDTS